MPRQGIMLAPVTRRNAPFSQGLGGNPARMVLGETVAGSVKGVCAPWGRSAHGSSPPFCAGAAPLGGARGI